jgi:hypothetical protein
VALHCVWYRWRFKFFVVFPQVIKLRHLDHISRPVFPLLYGIVVAYFLAQVDNRLVKGATPCY